MLGSRQSQHTEPQELPAFFANHSSKTIFFYPLAPVHQYSSLDNLWYKLNLGDKHN